MSPMNQFRIADLLGSATVVYLLFLWGILFNPFRWYIFFPGGPTGCFFSLLLVVCASIIATRWGRWAWRFVAGVTLITCIYVFFFSRPPAGLIY